MDAESWLGPPGRAFSGEGRRLRGGPGALRLTASGPQAGRSTGHRLGRCLPRRCARGRGSRGGLGAPGHWQPAVGRRPPRRDSGGAGFRVPRPGRRTTLWFDRTSLTALVSAEYDDPLGISKPRVRAEMGRGSGRSRRADMEILGSKGATGTDRTRLARPHGWARRLTAPDCRQ